MCAITLVVWLLLFLGVVAFGMISGSEGRMAVVTGISLVLAVILPLVGNFWQPLIMGWHKRKEAVRKKLQADGVLTAEDIDNGAKIVRLWEAVPGTEKKVPKTQQDAFLLLDVKTLRIFGEKTCINTDDFKIIPGCTGRCSRCVALPICGGDTFRLVATTDAGEKEYLLRSREGRNLRRVAEATEMLEELVDVTALESQATTEDSEG